MAKRETREDRIRECEVKISELELKINSLIETLRAAFCALDDEMDNL